MTIPVLKNSISEHRHEFTIEKEKYMVKWLSIEPDTDGAIRFEVTVHHWEHVGDDLYRWFKISETPVIIRKWLPTHKRSKKLIPFYL